MDFLALCQALGLALASGLLVGVVLPPVMPPWGVLAAAAPLAVIGAGLALNGEGEAVWPALPIGVLAGGLAALVSRDVAAGASRRAAQGADPSAAGPSAGVVAIVAVAAVALALAGLFAPPLALVAAVGLAWLWLGRRRAAEQKHEGLRVLR